jgi:hypothetical protein
MGKLEENLENFEYLEKKFSEWQATEIIMSDKRAFWQLKAKNSECQKVCLYRDGHTMFVYGDYGQLVFDSMTWEGSPYNLQYDNIGYQMEKLSNDCRNTLHVFDDSECKKDILEWFKNKVQEYFFEISEEDCIKVEDFLESILDSNYIFCEDEIRDYLQENGLSDIEDIAVFTGQLLWRATDEIDYVSYLRNNDFSDFDDMSGSDLWNAGKRISQRYFINMYALKVLRDKLQAPFK